MNNVEQIAVLLSIREEFDLSHDQRVVIAWAHASLLLKESDCDKIHGQHTS